MANKKYKLTDGNMWATDGIHDFGQNKTQRTINSEVNSALGGKAPTNHASTATTYGAASTSNYGHVKLSNTTPSMDGTAAVGDSTDVARANHVHPSDTSRVPTSRKVNNKQLSSDITLAASDVGAAPTDHASTATTYGKGTSSNYGHVKISDSLTDTTTAATGGVVPSMKAVSDLNGAITDGTLLNGMPQTSMRIPANSNLNSYTTAGTYYIASDADAATIANTPRNASGTIFVINRGVENYETQFYYPTSSPIINFVRNYNNGTWTDWQTNRNPNSNLATLEDDDKSKHTYVVGELLVWIGTLYRVISPISVGDNFSYGTNITPATLSTIDESGAGYCRMADGTLMQWGVGTIPSGSYVQPDYTTFAKPFKDTNYITVISPDDDINIQNPTTANKTTTGFKCGRSPNTATNNYTWYAIGRWK